MEPVIKTLSISRSGFVSFVPTATSTIIIEQKQTYTATLGETVTVLAPWTVQMPPVTQSTLPATITVAEILLVVYDQESNAYTTLTSPMTLKGTDVLQTTQPPYILTTNHDESPASGWTSWSSAQRGGLIAGITIVFLLILAILFILMLRKRYFIANDLNVQSHPDWVVGQPTTMVVYGHR